MNAFSFSIYLPKRMLMLSLKIMQTTRNQEETLTASKKPLLILHKHKNVLCLISSFVKYNLFIFAI